MKRACKEHGEQPDAAFVRRFRDLVRQWKEATIFTSSGTEIAMHSAYQQIIGTGKEAICDRLCGQFLNRIFEPAV